MAKIKAIDPKIKGMSLCVPFDGIISIDADGVAVVSDKAAKILVEGTNDWKMYDEGKGTETDKKGSEKAEETVADGPLYNLAGQRVGKSYKGTVVKNNVKYVK